MPYASAFKGNGGNKDKAIVLDEVCLDPLAKVAVVPCPLRELDRNAIYCVVLERGNCKGP